MSLFLVWIGSGSGQPEEDLFNASDPAVKWPLYLAQDEFVVIDTLTVDEGRLLFVVAGRDFLEDTILRCLSKYRKPQFTLEKVQILWIPKGGLGEELGGKVAPRDYIRTNFIFDSLRSRSVMLLHWDELQVAWFVQPRSEFTVLQDSVQEYLTTQWR